MTTTAGSRVRFGLALASSLASVMLGYLLMGHFVMATLTWTGNLGPEAAGDWYSPVYYLTHSWLTFLLIGWAVLVLALGWAASRLAGHDPDRRSRGSLQAIAARFAIGGLIAGVVDVVLVGTLVFIGRVWIWWY